MIAFPPGYDKSKNPNNKKCTYHGPIKVCKGYHIQSHYGFPVSGFPDVYINSDYDDWINQCKLLCNFYAKSK